MKEPETLRIREKKDYGDSLFLSHLSDIKKCHIMTSSYGEVTSTSLNKTEVRRVIKWLIKWLKFKECEEGGGKE